MVEFVWRHSIARTRKPLVIREDIRDISYASQVIADFVPNSVAMATGAIKSNQIKPFNSENTVHKKNKREDTERQTVVQINT